MPIYRDGELYLSKEKAGLLQNVCPEKRGVGVLFPPLPQPCASLHRESLPVQFKKKMH